MSKATGVRVCHLMLASGLMCASVFMCRIIFTASCITKDFGSSVRQRTSCLSTWPGTDILCLTRPPLLSGAGNVSIAFPASLFGLAGAGWFLSGIRALMKPDPGRALLFEKLNLEGLYGI